MDVGKENCLEIDRSGCGDGMSCCAEICKKFGHVERKSDIVKPSIRNKKGEFICFNSNCGQVFTDANALRRHKKIHRKRSYECSFPGCGKAFYENTKLKRHQQVHSQVKKFVCEVCGKAVGYKTNLITHQKIHTGFKPWVCRWDGCEKRFFQRVNRKTHERTHLNKNLPEDIEKRRKFLQIVNADTKDAADALLTLRSAEKELSETEEETM